MKFFSSDHHFGHKNVLEYTRRPWATLEQMHDGLIYNWNSVVQPHDEVYCLGDFSFYGKLSYVEPIVSRLNGHKYLVLGNHDRKNKKWHHLFKWARDYHELSIDFDGTKTKVVLQHYPSENWNKCEKGSWMLHGHMHRELPLLATTYKKLDVGVDGHGYMPWSLNQLKSVMRERQNMPYRHG